MSRAASRWGLHPQTPGLKALLVLALAIVSVAVPDGQAAAQPRPAKPAPKLTKPPKLVTFVEAPYPEAERASGKTATVTLQVAISAKGTVDEVAVTESGGAAFDAAAVQAVKQFVFSPAEIDDKPAPVKILYRYTFTIKVEAPVTAVFDGVVRARTSQRPMPRVALQVDGGPRAVTDDAGHFHVEGVPPGKHAVTLSGEKLSALHTEETFEAGKRLDATYEIEDQEATPGAPADDESEIVVTAPPLKKQVLSTEVPADQGRKVAGAAGDVLKVVENLPGVARSTVGSGALVVWGASPQDTRVYIDGVRVPRLYHDGGLRSEIHTDLVQSVELAPGGYGAAYGGGLGGLVTVQLRPLDEAGFHGSVAADVFDAAATVRASIGDDVHVAIAARKSWLDLIFPLVTSRNVGALFPIPRYADGQARLAYRVDTRTTVEVGGMISSDSTQRTAPLLDPGNALDPNQVDTETTSLFWTRVYAHYRHDTEGGGAVTITPSFGTERSSLSSLFGGIPADLTVGSTVFGLRASWRGKPLPNLGVSVGLDAEAVDSKVHRSGSVTSPPREGDVFVFGEAPSDQINTDDYRVVTVSAAPFVEADWALAEGRVHVLPGFRFDPYAISGSRSTPVSGDAPSIGFLTGGPLFEPRLAATFDASPRVRFKAAYGRYHELPQPEDLSAVFGNPLLSASRADHFLAGGRFDLGAQISVETTAFYTTSTDLAARSASPSPALAQALEQTGSGRSYGAQVLVRKDLSAHVFGWLSYSIIRSERQDAPGDRWRLFDFDQTHVLTALASYAIGGGFEAGARFRYATGFPRTPVTGAYFDVRTDTWQPMFGVQNTIRIPPFASLDLRVSKLFKIGKTELEVYLEAQNATNRQNPEEIVYTYNYAKPGYITGLPILPSLGARFAW
jgi:TonB family protein